MKITNKYIQKIIKEETQNILNQRESKHYLLDLVIEETQKVLTELDQGKPNKVSFNYIKTLSDDMLIDFYKNLQEEWSKSTKPGTQLGNTIRMHYTRDQDDVDDLFGKLVGIPHLTAGRQDQITTIRNYFNIALGNPGPQYPEEVRHHEIVDGAVKRALKIALGNAWKLIPDTSIPGAKVEEVAMIREAKAPSLPPGYKVPDHIAQGTWSSIPGDNKVYICDETGYAGDEGWFEHPVVIKRKYDHCKYRNHRGTGYPYPRSYQEGKEACQWLKSRGFGPLGCDDPAVPRCEPDTEWTIGSEDRKCVDADPPTRQPLDVWGVTPQHKKKLKP